MTLLTVRNYLDTLFNWPEVDAVQNFLSIFGSPEAYIAGGYFRDRLAGKPWKDVDVFLPGDEPVSEGAEVIRYDLSNASVAILDGVQVNFIKMREKLDLAGVLARMDIGICQVGYDAKAGTLVGTQAYVDDVANKTLTLIAPEETDGDRDHLKRVMEKYPDHTIIRPEKTN